MGLKVVTEKLSEVKKDLRIEARVYYNRYLLKETFTKFGFFEIK